MNLTEYIAAKMLQPFAWGTNDCVTFSVGYVEQLTGRTFLPPRHWSTRAEAHDVADELGGLVEALDEQFEQVGPNYAKDGDIALCEGIVGLISGGHVVSPGLEGLVFRPRTKVSHAWTY